VRSESYLFAVASKIKNSMSIWKFLLDLAYSATV
jgi:hypothetical protein